MVSHEIIRAYLRLGERLSPAVHGPTSTTSWTGSPPLTTLDSATPAA